MQIVIDGENAEALMRNFAQVANHLGFVSRGHAVAVAQVAVARATAVPAESKPAEPPAEAPKPLDGEVLPPEKPKRGRPPKEKAPEPAEPEASAAEKKPLTTSDVVVAMKALAARCGVEAVSQLLDEFHVARASEVPAEKMAAFIQRSESWTA